ncbi:hypothetical protein Avbf_03652 [Armadillidium vulgare]|nr:hypothetical protein Avbf_03652 [Armadillidium vulgare]
MQTKARDDMLEVSMLYEILDSLRQESGECGLTTRSQKTVVTCIGTLKKNHEQEEDAISCLVLGTESANIYILDPEAFIILKQNVPAECACIFQHNGTLRC